MASKLSAIIFKAAQSLQAALLIVGSCITPALSLPVNPSSTANLHVSRDEGGVDDSFVPNFQDLSAVLSLLAADSVERRLVRTDSTQMLERCSSLWSIFGLVGLARVQLKVAAGLASAERAGVELKGAAGFTGKRTEESFNAWAIGSTVQGPWLDTTEQLLAHAKVTGTTWKKPYITACAYSQCPPSGRRFRMEILQHCALVIVTLGAACGPLLFLRNGSEVLNNIALALMLSGGFVGGCLLPFMLIHWNDVGVPHVATLLPNASSEESSVKPAEISMPVASTLKSGHAKHFSSSTVVSGLSFAQSKESYPMPLSSGSDREFERLYDAGDLIISRPNQRLLLWRNRSAAPLVRSGDRLLVRIAAGTSFVAILAAYIINYILLGSVPKTATYWWIGVQVAILAGRYWVWAGTRQWMRERHRGLLYIVSSRVCQEQPPPLVPLENQPFTGSTAALRSMPSARPPMRGVFADTAGSEQDKPRIMDHELIRFCVASACSKLTNSGVSTASNNIDALSKLGGTTPRDILCAPVFPLSHLPDTERGQYNLLRLPWGTMEEFYLAQGLVLGPNPLSYAGLFMAAILRNGVFVGVTTVHPFQHASSPRCRGLTMDGCEVLDSLVDATLGMHRGADEGMGGYHTSFRENVRQCRISAEHNGPGHVEIHAVYEGQYFEYQQVVPGVDGALSRVRRIASEAGRMGVLGHEGCKHEQCYFYGLVGRTF